jgi:anti-sigma factor RsiW
MRSRCRDVHAYADGELAGDAAASFREHLPECSRCLAQLEAIFALKGLAETSAAAITEAPITAQLPRVTRRWRPRWWLGLVGARAPKPRLG